MTWLTATHLFEFPAWLFMGYSSLNSGWTKWPLLAIQILVIGQILRALVGPFILRKVSKRIQVRRISLRSVRGVYVQLASMTIRIDRVGLSYHPSPDAARQFSFKVEGLWVEIHELKTRTLPRQSTSKRFSRMPTLADFGPSPMARRLWASCSAAYSVLEPYVRPVIRSFFVTSTRLAIRCLPVLTQVVDFELDRALITFTTLSEAHITIRSVTLSATVAFSNLESMVETASNYPETHRHRRFLSMAHLQTRFAGSVKRVWGRAWGRTQGSVSLCLKVQKVSGFANVLKWLEVNPGAGYPPRHACASQFAFVAHASHNNDKCFDLTDSTEVIVSFEVGQVKRIIREHSVLTSVKLPSIQFYTGPFTTLLRAIRELRKELPDARSAISIHSVVQYKKSPLYHGNSLAGRRPRVPKASLFRCVELSIKDISVHHIIRSKEELRPRYFTGHIHSLSTSLELGEPERGTLHKDFLGSCPERVPELDAKVFSYSFVVKDMTVRRRGATEAVPPSRVISIQLVSLQGFATQWTLLNMPVAPIFSGDPNAALLVVKLNVIAPQFSERVDIVTDILEHIRRLKPIPSPPRERTCIVCSIPRLRVDIAVDDVAACLTPLERDQVPASSLILSSTQCVISLSSCFRFFPLAKSNLPELRETDSIPLDVEFTVQSLLGPAFVTVLQQPFSLDAPRYDTRNSTSVSGIGGDPLLSLSAFEFTASGQTLGVLVEDTDQVLLDVASTITDIKCVTDAVSLELWQPSAIFSLKSLLNSGRDLTTHASRNKEAGLLKMLPGGISAHFAVGHLGIILTGKDINPDEELGLSRGIAAKSGLALQYCSMYDRQNYVRLPKRFTHSHDRQRLYVSEDLLFDAISVSSTSVGAPKNFALFRCVLWDTVLRTSIATEFAADQAYEAEKESEELKSNEFLWVRRVEINALSQYLSISEEPDRLTEQLQISVRVPNIQMHVQLFNAYCILLASRTLQSFMKPERTIYPRQPRRISIALKATVTTSQFLLKLPVQQQVCLRLNGLIIRTSEKNDMSAELGNLFAWVPSIQEGGAWEEFIRLRSWKVVHQGVQNERLAFSIAGEGARLRIPHGYVMADLILSVNLFVKCIRHLVTTVSSGAFRPIPPPEAEETKAIPIIRMTIGCISLEASDDPLESKLGLIWRAGFEAARSRLDREEAFHEKVAAIRAAEADQLNAVDLESRFSPQHTVSVEEAHERLLLVHSLSWVTLHREYSERQRRSEVNIKKEIRGDHFHLSGVDAEPLVYVINSSKAPPLLRVIVSHLKLELSPPSFPAGDLPDFLHDIGKGLPRDTEFTLLIPLHLRMSLGSTCVTLRDYPLPLLNIVQDSPAKAESWVIDTDFVIAEEVGTESSVLWKECPIVQSGSSTATRPLKLSVPKTTMPVKTYANPTVNVLTSQLTEFCWCNSYAPALQDVMRLFDTLTTPPPDPSPPVGFWDKIRLILHWCAEVNFASDVHLNLKGSRDPYMSDGSGAGFSFCWNGHTQMSVGHTNPENEVLQVRSDTMLVVIPELLKRGSDEVIGGGISSRFARGPISLNQGLEGRRGSFKKTCAKFSSGIKWGIGIVLERTCGSSCSECHGQMTCRLFDFLPHYEVKLQPKSGIPTEDGPEDSFAGFRSDFIHLSTSLSSSADQGLLPVNLGSSSFHLTPKTFAHFWSWWELFDRYLSIPIRQGKLFPNARPPSKKFSRHLATIKYRIGVQRLFISHFYVDDTKESWSEGVTHCVGVKGLVNSFEADMHQREQEAIVPSLVGNTIKKIRHKPFYAAEVKLTDLQLSACLATFVDSSKCLISLQDALRESKYDDIKSDDTDQLPRDFWFDMDDFVETDWEPTEKDPRFYSFAVASCPRFTYFRRSRKQPHHSSAVENSRFGSEDTHVCLMGKEQPVHSLQAEIVAKRLAELREYLASLERSSDARRPQNGSPGLESEFQSIQKKIRQLEIHIAQLREAEIHEASPISEQTGEYAKYLMPSDISIPVDWTEFDNVYQAHCPKFSLRNSTRDILIQYYYCSRARRGLEYHMATRAVKYIRDQVDAFLRVSSDTDNLKKLKNPTSLAAQVAAQALKRILSGAENEGTNIRNSEGMSDHEKFDPMAGWSSETVSQEKSHFCLLLKPQVVLRSKATRDSVLVLAALQATLQSHAILDTTNIDDPISGRVMTRTHAALSELQAFSPSATCPSRHDGVPLEVLLDLRAESSDFDRLVPRTNATFRYDKFNRLRLRNNVISATPDSTDQLNSHLQDQTDLVHIRVPQFTVSANSKNFADIANIITTLLLRSDALHKMHLSKVETLLFSYDFTDLSAAADVVEGLQLRLRRAIEHQHDLETMLIEGDEQGQAELMKMKAHIFLLSEELNLIFDAINLAQQKSDDKHNDTKMALKVHASAREISWGMVDGIGDLIAKLAIRGIEHNWLSRQDGSTVNNLAMVDFQAFAGSPDAEWPEILSKYREPSNHPLVKRGIFLEADWVVLAPVGGITIFERFILDLHPIRLQLEDRVGNRIMEYVWPARRERHRQGRSTEKNSGDHELTANAFYQHDTGQHSGPRIVRRLSADIPDLPHQRKRHSTEEIGPTLDLPPRRITSSRSFTDLRGLARQDSTSPEVSLSPNSAAVNRSRSEFLFADVDQKRTSSTRADVPGYIMGDDAAEMKTRSAQKSFVLVRISSMHILLSFHKDGSFFCRDARIHTRELYYRNQTWSFEELAEQFIPSDTSWRGWMRMAFHQPLLPVLPVARELLSKTKLVTKKDKVLRKARKIVKPKPMAHTPRTSEQSDIPKFQSQQSTSPKSRRLTRPKRSIETTESETTNDDITEPAST